MGFSSRRFAVLGACALALLAVPGAARAADAPGAPGALATWTEGDKDGMGTATSTASRAWLTLDDGELTEVYAPDLSTPSLRDLQFVVTDGKSFAEREREDATHRIVLRDPRSLTYRQVNTARSGRWRITKTYVTDPRRSAVLVKVRLESLTGRPYKLYALLDPALSNTGNDDVGETRGHALVARDDKLASALVSKPAATRVSSGYLGKSDGWTDLRDDFRMDWTYARAAAKGNVAQIAELPVTGRPGHRRATLSLGFGASAGAASSTAGAALRGGFRTAARRYAAGWHAYLDRLPRPRSAAGHKRLYDVSAMVLAGLEDKTYRGAGIASPSMAWVWGTLEDSGPYHLVWSRDLYQVATAQIAAGDRAAAGRSLDYLWTHQQAADGCLPQNTRVDGRPYWTGLQLDEVADPILLASQLGRSDPETWRHVERAAACILAQGPTSQERWENTDDWYSPATIAAEIAALICAADIADRNGATAAAGNYRAMADEWQRKVAGWTRTTNGPLSSQPYYLRVTTDGNANAGHGVHDRRRRAHDRPAARRRHQLPRARAAGGQARRRPRHPVDAAGRGPRARRDDAERAVLASLQLRRLRRDGRRQPVPGRREPRPAVAAARRRARRVRARHGRPPCGGEAPRFHRRDRERGRDAARAGLGRPAAAGRRAGHGHALRDAAGLDARAVHPPRLVDRRRRPGRAAPRRRLPLRAALPLIAHVPFLG